MAFEYRLLRKGGLPALTLCFILASAMVEDGTDSHESAGLVSLDSDGEVAESPATGHERGRNYRPRRAPQPVGRPPERRGRRERASNEANTLFQRALRQTLIANDEASRDVKEARGRVRAPSTPDMAH